MTMTTTTRAFLGGRAGAAHLFLSLSRKVSLDKARAQM
jgi:hypothetical protein